MDLGGMLPAIGESDGTVLLDNFVQRLRGELHLLAQVGELDGAWAELSRP